MDGEREPGPLRRGAEGGTPRRLTTDPHVDALQRIARELRSSQPTPEAAAALVRDIHRINTSLKPLADEFAQALGEIQRTAQSLLTSGILIITAVLLIGGITLSRRFLAQNERLQQTLADSELQLRHLVESAPLPLLIARASDQKLVYANERALEEFGLDFDAARQRSLADFYVDDENRRAVAEMLSRQGHSRLDNQFRFRARDQHRRIDEEVETPELPMAGDVLRGLAVEPLAQVAAVVNPFDLAQLALAVRVEMRPVAMRCVHQQHLSRQARRRDAAFFKEHNGLGEGRFQLHGDREGRRGKDKSSAGKETRRG